MNSSKLAIAHDKITNFRPIQKQVGWNKNYYFEFSQLLKNVINVFDVVLNINICVCVDCSGDLAPRTKWALLLPDFNCYYCSVRCVRTGCYFQWPMRADCLTDCSPFRTLYKSKPTKSETVTFIVSIYYSIHQFCSAFWKQVLI